MVLRVMAERKPRCQIFSEFGEMRRRLEVQRQGRVEAMGPGGKSPRGRKFYVRVEGGSTNDLELSKRARKILTSCPEIREV